MARNGLEQLLGAAIRELSGPLPDRERACGWDDNLWRTCREHLMDIQEGVTQGRITEDHAPEMNIPRALDHEGVLSGRMLELIAKLSEAYERRFHRHHA